MFSGFWTRRTIVAIGREFPQGREAILFRVIVHDDHLCELGNDRGQAICDAGIRPVRHNDRGDALPARGRPLALDVIRTEVRRHYSTRSCKKLLKPYPNR